MNPEIKAICLRRFEFNNDDFLDEKLEKYQRFELLCEVFANQDNFGVYQELNDDEFLLDIVNIFEINLFRELPPPKLRKEYINYGERFEKFNTTNDPIMFHLSLVYKLLSYFIDFFKSDPRIVVLIDDSFVANLLNLIKSEDLEERTLIAQVVQKIYVFIPSRRKLIETFVREMFIEILSNPSEIYVHLDKLLEIYLVMISALDERQSQSIEHFLKSFHQLPYIYYYHVELFSCTIKFLKQHPVKIIDVTKWILQSLNKRFEWRNSITTNRILTLVEINKILNLLLVVTSQPDHIDAIFCQIIHYLMPFFIENLKTSNAEIIKQTIGILANKNHQPYFEKYMSKQEYQIVSGIINDGQYLIPWEYCAHVQQVLYGLSLKYCSKQ